MSETHTATASTTIDAAPEIVWDALTDPQTIKDYLFGSVVETDWEVGRLIVFRGEWEGETYEDKGEIRRFEPERVLKYTTVRRSPASPTPPKIITRSHGSWPTGTAEPNLPSPKQITTPRKHETIPRRTGR